MKADSLLPADTEVRPSKNLNNLIQQDRRNIKSRANVMLGFKHFRTAPVKLAGIDLMYPIRKGQFNLAGLHFKDRIAPGVWNTVLSDQ